MTTFGLFGVIFVIGKFYTNFNKYCAYILEMILVE